MGERLARVVSYILHPLLMPTYGLLLLFSLDSVISLLMPYKARMAVVVVIFLNTALVPALFFIFLKSRRVISSLKMQNRYERNIPFIITAVFYFVTYIMLQKYNLPQIIYFLIFGSSCLIILAMIINIWWKISIHMIAEGGITGAFACICLYLRINPIVLMIALIMASGLTGFARLKLEAHSPAQVYAGFITGLVFMCGLFMFLR
ncbi:MAG: hypothetical protein BWY70_01254 [Bacteroidetes bacterium ADurb.Bin408]|nr:MAG: hypothetical protein BWY70_01254 [Bacteroidetes bacterium ADurb.Bin408]